MNRIKLGLYFDQVVSIGGGYQQSINAALLALNLPQDLVEVTVLTSIPENVASLASYGINADLFCLTFFGKLITRLRRIISSFCWINLLPLIGRYSPFEHFVKCKKIDLVYFLSPSPYAQDLDTTNFIITVWDLCHRDHPEFPEVRYKSEFHRRENFLKIVLSRATAIIVDSELSKFSVLRRYCLDSCRVYIIPFQASVGTHFHHDILPSPTLNINSKFNLDLPYIFYPAQFWPHKNHIYILNALKALDVKYNLKVAAIFSGGDKGNLPYIRNRTHELGLDDRIRFAGFVSNEELVSLYTQSLALVMPTYFGPTNLPPLEAFTLGVPVIYPNEDGLRDQVGSAALLIDLADSHSLAYQLSNLLTNKSLRSQLISTGYSQLEKINSCNRAEVLKQIVIKFSSKRTCWGPIYD